MTTDLEKEREAIRAAYVAHFGSDAGWRGESGGWFIEGYRAALAAPAAPMAASSAQIVGGTYVPPELEAAAPAFRLSTEPPHIVPVMANSTTQSTPAMHGLRPDRTTAHEP